MKLPWRITAVMVALHMSLTAHAAVNAPDDQGNTVVLQKPAQRIVTLSPHATELVFAAGGGSRIVGTVEYSDFPPAAHTIPRVGDHQQIDIERVIALKPDLLVAWLNGNSERQLDQLKRLGIPIYYSEPKKLENIPQTVERIGQLLGTEQQAQQTADRQRRRLAELADQYSHRPTVRVFYQVWDRPIYTLNGRSVQTDMLRLCGAENIFGKLSAAAPLVGLESVLTENPEVIITGDMKGRSTSAFDIWKPYQTMLAVRRHNLFSIDADLLERAGPRLIDGTAAVCEKIELARTRRKNG